MLKLALIVGGNWNNSATAGVFASNWNNNRSNTNNNNGFRASDYDSSPDSMICADWRHRDGSALPCWRNLRASEFKYS